ncbi:MAG: sigma-70 family RNA polymerase sigma factor [Pseudomonadota bacterium]
MADEKTDSELIAKVAAGDRGAMKEFYVRHSDAVYGFIRSRLADPMEASDVLHDTMLEVWRRADSFAARSSVRSWVFSIARNKAVDRLRQKSRTLLTDTDPDIEDDAPDPLSAAIAAQNAEKVRACVETLSDPHRAVVHLAFFEDLSYSEIADIEGCPVGTVKTRIYHAKKLLTRCLSETDV